MVFVLAVGRKMPLYIDVICLIIAAIGIIGNLATIVAVVINLKLRKPYFLCILTLAVADFLSICCMTATIFLEFEFTTYLLCIKPSFYGLASLYASMQLNSTLQVLLIASIKFLLLVYPIESRTYVTNSLVVILFFTILSVSACTAFLVFYFIMKKVQADEDTTSVRIAPVVVMNFPPVLIITILHFIKVIKLRKSPALKKEVQTMNRVVTIILGIFTVHHIQKFITLTQNIEILHFLSKTLTISALINHASNPLIYAAFTPLVQRPCKRLKEKKWKTWNFTRLKM
jgi:hypothetical protein